MHFLVYLITVHLNTLGLVVSVMAWAGCSAQPDSQLVLKNLTVAWQCSLVIELEANA